MKTHIETFVFLMILLMTPFLCQASITVLTSSSPDYTVTSGSDEQVYGTATSNQITIESGARAELINFAGSNSILIQSDSSLFTVSRSGSIVTFEGADGTVLKMPSTQSIQTVTFSNSAPLTLSLYQGKVMLDDQMITTTAVPIDGSSADPGECGAYVAPGVWKEFDCYNLAAIGKTTDDDPFTPSWRLIGGYWQWGRKGPSSSQWYDTNTEHFAHGPSGNGDPGKSQAIYFLLDQNADLFDVDVDGDGVVDLLANINCNGLRLKVDDVNRFDIEFEPSLLTNGVIKNHADFVNALQEPLRQLITQGKLPADTTLAVDYTTTDYTYLDDGSRSSDIPAMIFETTTSHILETVGFKWVEDLIGEYNIFGRITDLIYPPTSPDDSEVNSGSITGWDQNYASDGAWTDEYKTINDPCPLGFRVPTQSQWEGVLDNNTESTLGTWDFDDTNYSSARFFGSYLMLPSAGRRDYGSGVLFGRGYYGHYWSSSEYINGDAQSLYFHSNYADASSYGERRYGFSVRCIAEDSDAGFYAGIIEMTIGNENNVISSFSGKSIESGIHLVSDDPDNQFSFEIKEGPSGMAVDSDGIVTYLIPESAETGTSIPFKVNIMNTTSNENVVLEASIYIMQAVEIASGIVTSDGGSVSDQTGDIVLEVPAGSVSQDVEIKIIQGRDADNNPAIDLLIDGDIEGSFELYLPDPDSYGSQDYYESLDFNKESQSLQSSGQYPLKYSWVENNRRYFTYGGYRLPLASKPGLATQFVFNLSKVITMTMFPIGIKDAYLLDSTQPLPTSGTTLTGEPVLFVHGYLLDIFGFGGGEGTWGNFPLLIGNLNNGEFIPFEFRWRTNARFQDVADDLGECLALIESKTGKKVHIVAHSFGGVLTRTLLQNLNENGDDYARYVASVTTLGTPHSGIFDDEETAHAVMFPKGQDSWTHSFGAQISTHQMGEPNFIDTAFLPFLGVEIEKGKIAADLANTADSTPPSIPIQVGIGLTTDRDDPLIIDEGDKLITYEGQRFHPNLTLFGTEPLLKNSEVYGGMVTEKLLGFGDRDAVPGDDSYFIDGYAHTDIIVSFFSRLSEAKVTCSDNETCQHASYIAVKDWLETHGQDDDEPIHGECGAYIAPGVWKEFDCYNLAAIGKTTNDDPFTPSWRLIGGYWQWGRKGPDSSQWYDTNTEHFAHGPTGLGEDEANESEINGWDNNYSSENAWSDNEKTAYEPCPSGYRVPTRSQWEGTDDNNDQSIVGTWDSNDTNYSSGRFFGNDLMLPAAGYRYPTHFHGSGALYARGYYGYYWSSSEYSSWNAYRLKVSSSRTDSGWYSSRLSGHSVRCIAE